MIHVLLANILLNHAVNGQESATGKPYVIFPLPLELPNRNDRSDQCWLRIEDVDLTETFSAYCTVAHDFLRSYIYDYNSKKMDEDGVNVSLWSEEPKGQEERAPTPSNDITIKDWKVTTVFDPITRKRLYVSKKADCRLIMYTREGMSNYNVNCERILYFFNMRANSASGAFTFNTGTFLVMLIFLLLF